MRNHLINTYRVKKPGGYRLLSTPNITSFLSRAVFFLTGRFHQFNDGDLSYGHINALCGLGVLRKPAAAT